MSWSIGEQSAAASPFSSPSPAGVHGAGPGAQNSANSQAGPFSPQVNALLSQSFGNQSLSDISVARGEGAKNQKISAEAHTIDRHISLGDHIKEDPSDAHSMEVIAHEVSHALARGGTGQHLINRAGDPGEHAAYDAGRQFKDFVSSGAKGAAPQLKPAHGGRAAIHRFEGGEHKDAMDGAVDVLKGAPPANRAAVKVDPQVAELMTAEITMGNGLKVKPGDLTAMMGDFYGVYNKDGTFNPQKSFEAMNAPDNRAEMEVILAKIKKEHDTLKAGDFKPSTAKELEEITLNRHKKTDADGAVSGLSMLELAERNNAHFSSKDSKGTDNNMGAYESFHKLAIDAARAGKPELARAYESSGMHFLTDRHAGGHQFDKAGVQNAYKEGGAINPLLKVLSPGLGIYDEARNSDTLSQGATHIVHDHFNKEGVTVANESGDKPWLAKGDKHWGDADNADNRYQTSKSIYTSFSELNDVMNGKTDKQIEDGGGYAARKTVPKFDDETQKKAEDMARKLTVGDVVSEEKENLGLISSFAKRKWVNTKNWFGDKWDGAKSWVGDKYQGAKDWVGDKYQGAKDWVGDKWQGAKDWVGDKYQGAKDWVGDKYQGAKDWVGDKWQGAKDLGGQAVDWGKEKLHNAKDWVGDKWQGAKDLGGQAVDWGKEKLHNAKDWVGDKWQGAKDLGGQAVDWGKEKLHDAGELGGQAVDWGKKKISNAWEGTKDVASKGAEAVSSGWGWLKKKAGF